MTETETTLSFAHRCGSAIEPQWDSAGDDRAAGHCLRGSYRGRRSVHRGPLNEALRQGGGGVALSGLSGANSEREPKRFRVVVSANGAGDKLNPEQSGRVHAAPYSTLPIGATNSLSAQRDLSPTGLPQ